MQLSPRKSLRYKFVLLFIILLMDIFAVVIMMRYFYTLPQLHRLEQKADNQDIQRIKRILQSKIDELALVNYDNAVWNDSYEIVLNSDQEFIDDNFVTDTFRSLDINGLYFYDIAGNLVWGQTLERAHFQTIDDLAFSENLDWLNEGILVTPDEVRNNNNKPVTHKGVIFINKQPALFAATAIMPSEGIGQSRGTLLFYRKILPRNEQALIENAAMNLKFIWPNSPEYSEYLLHKSSNPDFLNKRNQNQWITFEGRDYLNHAPYFISFQASERLFETELLNKPILIALFLSLFGVFYVFMYVNWHIVGPIIRWQQTMRQVIDNNQYNVRLSSDHSDELGALATGFNRLMDHVEEQNQQITEQNKRLLQLSNTDSLTQVNNRRYFDTYLHDVWKIENAPPLSLCLCDVDYFKPFNDNYGHQAGDRTLITIAQTLLNHSKRASDIVARYGGEEFAVILEGTGLQAAERASKHFLEAIANLGLLHEHSPFKIVTVSIGVASITPNPSNSPRTLIHQADLALYRAKQNGRNRVICYSPDMET